MGLFGRKTESKEEKTRKSSSISEDKPAKKKTKAVNSSSRKASRFEEVLLRPVITEKAYNLSEAGKYVFYVHPNADKRQVAEAVEDIYSVDVEKVNMIRMRPQRKFFRMIPGKTKVKKKAVVTLKKGQKLDLFS